MEQSATFLRDAVAQIEPLVEAEEWSRVDRVREDLAELQVKLGHFPELGRGLAGEGQITLRRISVRRLPYLVWYLWDPRDQGFVQLQRIFHARQRTPKPRLP